MSSASYRGKAGESSFRVPFVVTSAADIVLTVNGTPASFTYANEMATLTSALSVDSDVVLTDAGHQAKEAGESTEETLRALAAAPVALGHSQITGLSAAKDLGTIPSDARYAVIQASGNDVRWRDDGTDPTATVGQRILTDGELVYDATDLTKIKFIEVAASAVLDVAFYA